MSRMTYMPQFPALQRLHDDTLERLREWLRVHPGDFGSLNDNDDAAIRARNHACTPTEVWHFPPEFAGLAGGETGV